MQRCDGCQRYARQAHVPAQELRTIPITWPFVVWGLDMVGPFQMSPCKKTHLLVAIDKFTKWVEVMPISNNEAITVVKFLKKIIYRFGYPHSRSEERRVGKECLRLCRSRWSPYH